MFKMSRLTINLFAVAALVLFFVENSLAGAPKFSAIDYPGASATFVLGTNPAGDIVGAYDDSTGEHGFLLHAGTYTSFDYPGSTWTDAYGITPAGDIVGQYGATDNTTRGFLLRKGDFYPIEIAGPTDMGLPNSMPFKISPSGLIVGCYHQSKANGAAIAGTMHGFSLSADSLVFEATVGTMNLGVNPDGAITGYNASTPQSYVVIDGVQTWFVFPGAAATRATDISATGVVIGWYKDSSGHFHGFTKRGDAFATLDVDMPGALQTRPESINALGEIVGYYQNATGWHGFVYSRRDTE